MSYLLSFTKKLVLIGCIPLFFLGCKDKVTSFQDEIVITGYDARRCACCGGFMVNFSEDPSPYAEAFKLVQTFPEGIVISNTSDFPIYAKINWSPINDPCENNDWMVIEEMVIIE